MADNKMGANLGGNIGAGAGILAKRFQKSMNRAQEKVMQKLGKAMETKDVQFEQCSLNLNKQQADGAKLFKDVKAYYNAVKVMHETSKRLSLTLRDVYESDWEGGGDLSVIMESEDLLWNDYEEKLSDQIVRTMDNYTGQFPEVKERVAKRGRKLVDYDSARHHLEAMQSTKKKDEAKAAKAEEEFNKSQSVFEDINKELREELPVLYQSRIGCYVTVFQNISNLRDVFYKEMSVLNHEIYSVMKKLESQHHSGKAFIIKGLNSTKQSKKRKSLLISAPIPCNTAFPSDRPSASPPGPSSSPPAQPREPAEKDAVSEVSDDDDDFSSFDSDTPKRQSVCSAAASNETNGAQSFTTIQLDHGGDSSSQELQGQSSAPAESGGKEESADAHGSRTSESEASEPAATAEPKTAPVPAPRLSERVTPPPAPLNTETEGRSAGETDGCTPPGFLYKVVAVDSQTSDEGILLLFEKGDVILVFTDDDEKPEGSVWGVREPDWIQHHDLTLLSGIVMETLIQRIDSN